MVSSMALIFADDIFLLSASRNGLQAMINLCHDFVAARNLKFGTHEDPKKSKTKCIVFTKKKLKFQPMNVTLNGNQLPWVTQVKHLGHMLQSDSSMKIDIAQKRGGFVGKINSMLQEFHCVSPEIFIKLMNTYATSIYGSNTWDIFSPECERLYKSYNVTIRNALKVDRCTHKYMLEPLSESVHLRTMLASRYTTFHSTLVQCKKFPVRFLARICEEDMRTTLGRTLSRIKSECEVDSLTELNPAVIKKKMRYSVAPIESEWKVEMATELLQIRDGDEITIPNFTSNERTEILKHICTD